MKLLNLQGEFAQFIFRGAARSTARPCRSNGPRGTPSAAFRRILHDPTKSPIPGDLNTAPVVIDPTTSKPADDLSLTAFVVYTDTSLCFAFRVVDQFVDAQEEDARRPTRTTGSRCSSTATGLPATAAGDANGKELVMARGLPAPRRRRRAQVQDGPPTSPTLTGRRPPGGRSTATSSRSRSPWR